MHPDILYWLAATRLSGVGPVKLRSWLTQLTNVRQLFSANTATLIQAGLQAHEIQSIKSIDWKSLETDLAWCEKNQVHILTQEDAAYPPLLREIASAPVILYVLGNISLLSEPQLAIVGSRNPTPSGKQLAEQFATALTQAGLVITSGLALGVDAASHRGVLKIAGKTLAVMGTGLNQIYPRSNYQLAQDIIANQGALVSEFAPHTPPVAQNFPIRNRIISGLSIGVLVIEAALRSGSLITARCAADQGREVFAIPGSIQQPLARGCHALIRQGAKLVETAQDILEELSAWVSIPQQPLLENLPRLPKLDKKLQELIKQIDYTATSFDTIIKRSGLTASEVSSMLLALELYGHVHVVSGGYARFSLS